MQVTANIDSRLARLADVAPPVAIKAMPHAERRDFSRRAALQRRICNEFEEMPGTSLTIAQGARLFGLAGDVCSRVLTELVHHGQLQLSADRRYRSKSAA